MDECACTDECRCEVLSEAGLVLAQLFNVGVHADRVFLDVFAEELEMLRARDCSICLGTCISDAVVLRCGHAFHSECAEAWRGIQNRCPNCRASLE